MLEQAVKCPLTPVLAASNSEQFFSVVWSDSSLYHIGPKIQPKFSEGIKLALEAILWEQIKRILSNTLRLNF